MRKLPMEQFEFSALLDQLLFTSKQLNGPPRDESLPPLSIEEGAAVQQAYESFMDLSFMDLTREEPNE